MSGDPKTQDWDGSRFYRVGDELYPSVTEILSVLSKPALVGWAANRERELLIETSANLYEEIVSGGASRMSKVAWVTSLTTRLTKVKAHERITQKAASIGTETAKLIEWWVKHELDPQYHGDPRAAAQPEVLQAFEHFRSWFNEQKLTPVLSEKVVVSKQHRYAGTLDVGAERDGGHGLVLIDFKVTEKLWPEYDLQVQAYADALRESCFEVIEAWVVKLPKLKTEKVEQHQVELVHGESFRHLRAVWQWRWDQSHPKGSMVEAVKNQLSMTKREKEIAEAAKYLDPGALKDGRYEPSTTLFDD